MELTRLRRFLRSAEVEECYNAQILLDGIDTIREAAEELEAKLRDQVLDEDDLRRFVEHGSYGMLDGVNNLNGAGGEEKKLVIIPLTI